MKYMLLIYGNHEAWAALTPEAGAALHRAHGDLQRELTASGELVENNELSIVDARVMRGAGKVITDGPFAEVKEVLAGYYVVDCADLDRATEIAGRLHEIEFALVDIRRIGSDRAGQ